MPWLSYYIESLRHLIRKYNVSALVLIITRCVQDFLPQPISVLVPESVAFDDIVNRVRAYLHHFIICCIATTLIVNIAYVTTVGCTCVV